MFEIRHSFIRIVILAYFKLCIIYLVLCILQITFYSSKLFFALFKYRGWLLYIMMYNHNVVLILSVYFIVCSFLHCICFEPLCRILTYWLMLSVLNTTLNKDYSILFYSILPGFSQLNKIDMQTSDIIQQRQSRHIICNCILGNSDEKYLTNNNSISGCKNIWNLHLSRQTFNCNEFVGGKYYVIYNRNIDGEAFLCISIQDKRRR